MSELRANASDMDARTLSFARNGGEMRLAYENLPPSVYAYLCGYGAGEVFAVTQ